MGARAERAKRKAQRMMVKPNSDVRIDAIIAKRWSRNARRKEFYLEFKRLLDLAGRRYMRALALDQLDGTKVADFSEVVKAITADPDMRQLLMEYRPKRGEPITWQ